MINLVQPTKIKSPVVANLQRLGFSDPPLYQGIAMGSVVLAPLCLISGNANIVQGVLLPFEPVDLFPNQAGFQFSGTPAQLCTRPTVALGWYPHPGAALQTIGALLRLVEHQPLKTMGMAQSDDMDAAFPIEKIVQFGDMGLHLRKFHARIRIENAVNGHFLFHHQQKERGTVFPSAQADSVIKVRIFICFR